MKTEVSPVIIGIVIAVLLVVIGIFGFRTIRPAPYQMSPGGGPRALPAAGAVSPSSGGSYTPSGTRPGGGLAGSPDHPAAGMTGSPNGGAMSGAPGSGSMDYQNPANHPRMGSPDH